MGLLSKGTDADKKNNQKPVKTSKLKRDLIHGTAIQGFNKLENWFWTY